VGAFMALAMTTSGMAAIDSPAAADLVWDCGTTVDARPSIVFVHGFDSSPVIWDEGDSNSMKAAISGISRANIVGSFDYTQVHWEWVGHDNIGPRLANHIHCLADASRRAGGDGKIILIAHSMGGLAIREAIHRKPEIEQEIGLVITIATPHQGATLAVWGDIVGHRSACKPGSSGGAYSRYVQCRRSAAVRAMQPGSRELSNLPDFPASVPVRAIAGNVIGYLWTTNSDGVVTVSSATEQYTTDYPGDGRFVFDCYRLLGRTPTCEHSALIQNPGVQANVMRAIGEYLDSQMCVQPSHTSAQVSVDQSLAPLSEPAGPAPDPTPTGPAPDPTPSSPAPEPTPTVPSPC